MRVIADISMSLDGFVTGPDPDDELRVHLSPIVLGAGTPLFGDGGVRRELVQRSVPVSSTATHLTYEVR